MRQRVIGAQPNLMQVVWKIVRKVLFTTGQQPLIKNLLADLREKYGREWRPSNRAEMYFR